jgi:hypothetical protein
MYSEASFYRHVATAKSRQTKPKEDFTLSQLRAQRDFHAFRWYLTQDTLKHRTYPHQLEWGKLLNTGQNSKCLRGIAGSNTLILSPRGSAKSTYAVQWIAWVIGIHAAPGVQLDFKILYACFVLDIALLKSIQIKSVIESVRYQEVFPWVRPSRKWADGLWKIDNKHAGIPEIGEPYTLACAGLTGAVASKRSHLIMLDDLIKSPSAIANPDVRQTMRSNWHGIVKPTLFDGGRAVCLGTRMRPDDIYTTDFTSDKGWSTCTTPSIITDDRGVEHSYCEKLYSLQSLIKLRKEDPVSFGYQFQNEITYSADDDLLHPDLVIKDKPPRINDFDALGVGCDLSTSLRESADFTVLTLLGRLDGVLWILDIRRGRYSGNIDKCDVLIEMLLDWGILETTTEWKQDRAGRIEWEHKPPHWKYTGMYCDFFPEQEGYQKSMVSDYDRHMDELKIHNISCCPMKVKGDKRQKFKSITGLFQLGRVFFNKYRNFDALIQELTLPGGYDDCVDSLVLGMNGLGTTNMEMG